nr:hypothetical protein [Streptomyces sp. MH191]
MCIARQRAATGAGEAKALRRAPVMAVKTMRRPATEPSPMSMPMPVTPRLKGITAAMNCVWSSASLTVTCRSRKATEEMAVVRCTACATMRWRVLRKMRSVATRPQITEQDRATSDSTPAPKLRKSRTVFPPASTTTGIRSRTTALAGP